MRDRARSVAYGALSPLGSAIARFQGGAVILSGWGCAGCGEGFWVEDERARLVAGDLRCPRCTAALEVEITRLREGLWDCAAAAGADHDGDATPEHLTSDIVEHALREVRELRGIYDELEGSISG